MDFEGFRQFAFRQHATFSTIVCSFYNSYDFFWYASFTYILPDAISINLMESLLKVDEDHMQIRPEFFAPLYDEPYQVDVVSA